MTDFLTPLFQQVVKFITDVLSRNINIFGVSVSGFGVLVFFVLGSLLALVVRAFWE